MLYLAQRQEPSGYVSVQTIGKALCISPAFLTKVFQRLTDVGLTESMKGPRGGVRLARGPEQITLADIVRAIDGDELFTQCILGLPGCGEDKPCPVHDQWRVHRSKLQQLFESYTLDTLLHKSLSDLRLSFC